MPGRQIAAGIAGVEARSRAMLLEGKRAEQLYSEAIERLTQTRMRTELARAEQVQPPTMTKVVTGLETDGLARRAADPDDARAVRVEATARGRRLLVDGRRRRVARLAGGLTTLLPEELDVLAHAAAIIERVAARL